MEQMSFFDFESCPIPPPSPLDGLGESAMVRAISKATGLSFKYNDYIDRHEAKRGALTISIAYNRFTVNNRAKFISVHSWDKKRQGGTGCPCETLEEAIEVINREVERSIA